jgi:citrate synthase
VYSAIVGAVGALKGRCTAARRVRHRHGVRDSYALPPTAAICAAASQHVRRMMADGERIMGFGHRVYRVRDPRADVLGAAAARLYEQGADRRLYDDVRAVEDVVLSVFAELKPGRRIQTNVEFYTALLLHGIGLDSELFTPPFAVARTGGWTAHVLEQAENNRLIRPAANYVGPQHPHWGAPGPGERMCAN